MAMLKCEVCGEMQDVPMHCGEQMKIENDKLSLLHGCRVRGGRPSDALRSTYVAR